MPLDSLASDFRLAARRLVQRPGFTVVAVLTLALGLGANIAIFTLVRATMFQTLPVSRPHELVRLGDNDNCCVNSGLQDDYSLYSYQLYSHLRDNLPDLSSLAAFQALPQPVGIRRVGTSATETFPTEYVSANYFATFGVPAAAGRVLEPSDDRAGAEPVFVMSYATWARRYGRDASLVGGAFLIGGKPMTLVGIAAEEFFGDTIRPDPPAIWVPLGQEPYARGAASLAGRADQDWLYAIGRLREGASPAAVEARATSELRTWLNALSTFTEDQKKRIGQTQIRVVSAAAGVAILRYTYARPLTLLFVTSALVLVIAAANLANLLLARMDPGQVAIQTALGASIGRLVRQSLSEGLLLASLGAAVGLGVAALSTRAAVALTFARAETLPFDLHPSAVVLAFAAGLAILTGVLFSAAPAWATARSAPIDALRGVGRSGEQRSFVPRRSLVIAQVALSVILLAGAGLLTESLSRLEQQPLGFQPEGRLVVRIRPAAPTDDLDRLAATYDRLRLRLRQIPGVLNATYSLYSPMEGNNWSSGISIEGQQTDLRRDSSSWNRIGPGYFETLGTRVLRGRTIDERDGLHAPRVALVNEAFVRRFLPNTDPIGHRLGIGAAEHAGDFEIVGIAEDVKYTNAHLPTRPMIFFPTMQLAPLEGESSRNVQLRSMSIGAIELHAAAGAGALDPLVRQAIAEIDPDMAVVRMLPMSVQVGQNFQVNRLMARLTAAYGLLALAVAALGLYGVTAYSVVRRTREIGVRMALGANRGRVLAEVVRGALAQTGIGLLIGLPAAAAATATLASLLYGVQPRDPIVFGKAAIVLAISAALAALVPARRAASIDPARALRAE
jgi:predicted permease